MKSEDADHGPLPREIEFGPFVWVKRLANAPFAYELTLAGEPFGNVVKGQTYYMRWQQHLLHDKVPNWAINHNLKIIGEGTSVSAVKCAKVNADEMLRLCSESLHRDIGYAMDRLAMLLKLAGALAKK